MAGHFVKIKELREKEIEHRKHDLDRASRSPKSKKADPIIICMYAEKGGVGKTTTCATLAFTFAKQGIRTLVYDCDSQRNLTSFMYGNELDNEEYNGDLDFFLSDDPPPEGSVRTLYHQVMEQEATSVDSIKPAYAKEIIPNLFFVAGHDELYLLDQEILTTEILSTSFPMASRNNLTARPYEAIKKTAIKYGVDYVLIDLNPNMGVLNQRIICTSHYMVVPAIADSFSSLMMSKMSRNLITWNDKLSTLIEPCGRPGGIPIPSHRVKFLGFIISRYIPIPPIKPIDIQNGIVVSDVLRNNQTYWMKRIQESADDITDLFKNETPLALSPLIYRRNERTNKLAMVREFWGLNEISSIFHLPVPFLNESNMYRRIEIDSEQMSDEATLQYLPKQEREKYLNRVNEYRQIYFELANSITKLIQSDREQQRRSSKLEK